MIDLETYRIRIGHMNLTRSCTSSIPFKKIKYKAFLTRRNTPLVSYAKICLKGLILLTVLHGLRLHVTDLDFGSHRSTTIKSEDTVRINWMAFRSSKITDHNFQARYINGNKQNQKGIINMHLNVRSLRFKVFEIKNLIKQHNPHILGISEAELEKDRIDENGLKIPGYNLLFPNSWLSHGYARVVLYVKKII